MNDTVKGNPNDQTKAGSERPVTAVIVGAGHRSLIYASYARRHPGSFRITGVVDPDPERRQRTAEAFRLPPEACFESVGQLTAGPRIADAAINGTMDRLHVETTLPLLAAGYDVLLEKPIATTEEQLRELYVKAQECGRIVMICHVLRYAPFYREIRKRIAAGDIGEIVNIQTAEHVSYHHMAASYIRGKWNSQEKCQSSMLMAKCCHDLDILTWMTGGLRPLRVGSFGSLMQFKAERAPEGSGERCLADCRIEADCAYSARKHYIEQKRWGFYVWENQHLGVKLTEEEKLESLRTTNPYGRCVWRCDNDVVDHQSVMVEFENGSTATHNMIGATSRPCRTIHIIGTRGEIQGVLEDGSFVVRHPDPRAGHQYSEEKVTVDVTDDSHGGGDLLLVEDFVRVLRGERASISSTRLEQSIYGHEIGFAAERSRTGHATVELAY
ncbi:Putative oxidoreductase YteT precursor [Paenibacillus konkukensis]|uniref:Oxidoreductase YteT n=1 Tax=Paenibacillus konkukensis TaxID=2020716 RepID=A0ABY4RMW6_9BACL|nr:Gfo/Idh/MocA family oxidoreductase [Paenibacillus konkukensis]UQZ83791.1 Putative oxidoreductase YteT precursor [Paenibacillus konkukensis]